MQIKAAPQRCRIPIPITRRSNGDCQSGSSPGSSSSLACAFPRSPSVTSMQARSLLQWRDRSGLRASALPAFSVRWNPSTPDPIVMLLYNIHDSTLDDHCQPPKKWRAISIKNCHLPCFIHSLFISRIARVLVPTMFQTMD